MILSAKLVPLGRPTEDSVHAACTHLGVKPVIVMYPDQLGLLVASGYLGLR